MTNSKIQLPITNSQFPVTDLHRYHKCLNGHDITIKPAAASTSLTKHHPPLVLLLLGQNNCCVINSSALELQMQLQRSSDEFQQRTFAELRNRYLTKL